ncbi:NACHT domain-containing protein [Phormidesmis sp. 146-12]
MSSQFQPYLESICATYEKWWEAYAFMDEIDASTWFEFELNSITKDKPKSPGGKPTDKPPQRVLQAVNEYANANEKILIVGGSGAGKSTLLARIFWQAAEKAQQDRTSPIPVLVELKAYQMAGDRSGIRGLILSSLESHDPGLDGDDLKRLLKEKERPLLLLVDGLNELPQTQAQTDLKNFWRNIPLIATARHAGDGWEIERKLELQPLSQHQVKDFLKERLPNSDRVRLQELGDRVRDFGQTPLMVWMLYCIFRTGNEIPATRGEAYRKFTNLYVERSKEGIDLTESRFRLMRLAFEMMQSQKPNEPTDFQPDIPETDAQNLLGSERKLRLLRDCHLLQSYGESGNPRVRFCHQSLQEYYAAEALLNRRIHLDGEVLKREYLNYLKWTEPVALMLGLVDEAQAVRLVKLALEVDLMLGARLAGEVKGKLQSNALADTLQELEKVAPESSWLKLKALRTMDSEVAHRQLADLVNHSDHRIGDDAYLTLLIRAPEFMPERCEPRERSSWVREVIESISKDPKVEELPPLHPQVIEHLVPDIRIIYDAWISGVLSSDEVLLELAPLLKNPNPQVRWSVVEVVGSLKSETSLPTLFRAIEDPESSVSHSAGVVIGQLGFKSAISRLIQIIEQNPNSGVRFSAVTSLRMIDSIEVIPGLLKAMQDSHIPVCREAVEASEKFDSEAIASGLFQIISHPDPHIRRLAASRLRILSAKENIAKFLNETHLQALVAKLEHSDPLICWHTAFILWNVASEEVILLLQPKLNSGNHNTRLSAALVLGKFGCQEAVPRLIQMLDYLNLKSDLNISGLDLHEISYLAAYALGQFEGTSAAHTLPRLRVLISTELGKDALRAMLAIQKKCECYNYEIFQAYLEAQNVDRSTHQESDRSPTTINNFPNATEVKIFENVDQYYETPPRLKDPPS